MRTRTRLALLLAVRGIVRRTALVVWKMTLALVTALITAISVTTALNATKKS